MRGTTPTLTFTTPYAAALIDRGYVTFKQRDKLVVDLPLSSPQVAVLDNAIKVTLTQAQTLSFNENLPCKVQIRAVLTSEKAVKSKSVDIPLDEVLKEGII